MSQESNGTWRLLVMDEFYLISARTASKSAAGDVIDARVSTRNRKFFAATITSVSTSKHHDGLCAGTDSSQAHFKIFIKHAKSGQTYGESCLKHAKSGHGYVNILPLKHAKSRTNLCRSFRGPFLSVDEATECVRSTSHWCQWFPESSCICILEQQLGAMLTFWYQQRYVIS